VPRPFRKIFHDGTEGWMRIISRGMTSLNYKGQIRTKASCHKYATVTYAKRLILNIQKSWWPHCFRQICTLLTKHVNSPSSVAVSTPTDSSIWIVISLRQLKSWCIALWYSLLWNKVKESSVTLNNFGLVVWNTEVEETLNFPLIRQCLQNMVRLSPVLYTRLFSKECSVTTLQWQKPVG
jgi:hypothetical protein